MEARSAGAAGLEGSQSCGTVRTEPQLQGWGRIAPSLALGWRNRRVRKADPTLGEHSQQLPGPGPLPTSAMRQEEQSSHSSPSQMLEAVAVTPCHEASAEGWPMKYAWRVLPF